MLSSSDSQELYATLTSEEGWIGTVSSESIALQTRARRLCQRYDSTDCADMEGRTAILQELFAPGGKPIIQPPFRCDYGFNIHFEGFAFLNYGVTILDSSPVTIGDRVMIAPGVVIASVSHALDPAQREAGVSCAAPIHIGRNVWIGANATICKGVSIGENSVIGAGSVVTHDIPANVVAFGAPCRVHRSIDEKDREELNLFV
ncbi:sugar O-acetyltransferase [Olsenella sp. Marseille-QA0557]|uniref:sugar O-acetyltransferase n=1 Tax=Olsenella sp. Marseille-QA0557 TaxID=3378782 RepID=UPI003D11617F